MPVRVESALRDRHSRSFNLTHTWPSGSNGSSMNTSSTLPERFSRSKQHESRNTVIRPCISSSRARVSGVARHGPPGRVEADPRPLPADVHKRGDGDQLVPRLVPVALDEHEQPVGQVRRRGRVRGHEELDDP